MRSFPHDYRVVLKGGFYSALLSVVYQLYVLPCVCVAVPWWWDDMGPGDAECSGGPCSAVEGWAHHLIFWTLQLGPCPDPSLHPVQCKSGPFCLGLVVSSLQLGSYVDSSQCALLFDLFSWSHMWSLYFIVRFLQLGPYVNSFLHPLLFSLYK